MADQCLLLRLEVAQITGEGLKILLEVGTGGLRTGADGASVVLKKVTGGAAIVDVGSGAIVTSCQPLKTKIKYNNYNLGKYF